MNNAVRVVIFVCALLHAHILSAYETQTHASISESAFDQSQLSRDTQLLQNLGLKTSDKFLNSVDSEPKTVKELISGGSGFEDGFSCLETRPRHHFFDPLTGTGMDWMVQLYNGTDLIRVTGTSSPDWALEDTGKQRNQDYSWKSARDYFYRALTAPTKDVREQNFGLGFQTLGHVIHHVQDMAQPQHVRNDVHYASPPNCGIATYLGKLLKESPSRYEFYSNLVRDRLLNDVSLINSYPPVNDKTDVSHLTSARQFWIGGGKGIAEFTNANFLSAGTNFNTNRYPSPSLAQAVAQPEPDANKLLADNGISVPAECLPPNPKCTMTFFATHVDDKYRPSASGDNLRASTSSMFDQDLQAKNAAPTFSLNRFNFDAAHRFLIPRAVAYSAGLINYFFRGRIEAQDAGYTDTGISLRIKNAIDKRKDPAWKDETLKTGGALIVAYDYIPAGVTNSSARVFGSSDVVTLKSDIRPGQASLEMYSFVLPEIPDSATDVHYRLVYRGKLGSESDAVVAGVFEPMSGFVVSPPYVPADGLTGLNEPRLVYKGWGRWRLSKKVNVTAANIDWKGWYGEDGRPTKVLSWGGPAARYFSQAGQSWSNSIYQSGAPFAYAPDNGVVGAAVLRDSQGDDWLVAICAGFDGEEIVYRRPYNASDSSALYDPATAPEGWRKIGRLRPSDFDRAGSRTTLPGNIPWFFSGNGYHAQTMRKWLDTSGRQPVLRVMRLEITISGDLTSIDVKDHTPDDPQGFTTSGSCALNYDHTFVGTGTKSSRKTGSYVMVVDYKNDQPVLGVVSTDNSGQGTSTFQRSATDVSGRTFSLLNGETGESSRELEIFGWSSRQVTLTQRDITTQKSRTDRVIGSDNTATVAATFKWTQGGASQNVQNLYYLDLRADLFSLYQSDGVGQLNVVVDNGSFSGSQQQTNKEQYRIGSTGPDVIPFSSSVNSNSPPDNPNGYFSNTSNYLLQCDEDSNPSEPITYSNRLMTVREDPLVRGAWQVDVNNNVLVSQQTYSRNNSQYQPAYNMVDGRSLEQLIPGQSASDAIYSFGVLGLIR